MLWEILRVEAKHFPRYFLWKQVVCVCSSCSQKTWSILQTGKIKFYSAALISFLIWSWTVFLTTFAFSGHSNSKLCPVKGADTLKISFVKKPLAYWKSIFCKDEPRALQSLIVIESDVKCCTLSFKLSINSIDIGHNSLYIEKFPSQNKSKHDLSNARGNLNPSPNKITQFHREITKSLIEFNNSRAGVTRPSVHLWSRVPSPGHRYNCTVGKFDTQKALKKF